MTIFFILAVVAKVVIAAYYVCIVFCCFIKITASLAVFCLLWQNQRTHWAIILHASCFNFKPYLID